MTGVNQWLALVLGAAAPLVRIVLTAVQARRLETLSAFTLSILAAGTCAARRCRPRRNDEPRSGPGLIDMQVITCI